MSHPIDNISDYLRQNFSEADIKTIAECTVDSVWVKGLETFEEISKVYDLLKEDIWSWIQDDIFGTDITPLQYIADLNGGDLVSNDKELRNILVWYALEISASLWLDIEEMEKVKAWNSDIEIKTII